MGRILAYVDAVPGRLYPLVPTLLELQRRGHGVTVRCGIDDVDRLRAAGLATEPLAPEIERFTPDDWRARTPITALIRGLGQFGERAPAQCRDLRRVMDAESPDALLIDEGAWGVPRNQFRPQRLRSAVRTAIGLTAGARRIEAAFAAAGGAVAAADAFESLVPMGSPTEAALA